MATSIAKATSVPEPFYPESDGEPMAESDLHWDVTAYGIGALKDFFASREDVYVAGDNFLYFLKGRPRAVVSPDCYVVFGAGKAPRPSYKVWEADGLLPSFVLEVTSKSTRGEDTGRKFELYRDILGIPEYFLFDPTADYIKTRLTGYRLQRSKYVPILPDEDNRLYSKELGLFLMAEGEYLRYFDPQRGAKLPTYREAREQARAESQLAEAATQRADAEAQRANDEAQARIEAEAEIERLRAELEALRKQG